MTEAKNVIRVNGLYEYLVEPTYKACMCVSLSNVYSGQEITYAELMDNYLVELAGANISKEELTADPLGYLLNGYEKGGNFFTYETPSIKQLHKFLNIRIEGVIKFDVTFEVSLSDEQMAKYAEAALSDARKRAELAAKSTGKKVGDICYIEDTNPPSYLEGFYINQGPLLRKYNVSVAFELI